jgi:hypothetical protein
MECLREIRHGGDTYIPKIRFYSLFFHYHLFFVCRLEFLKEAAEPRILIRLEIDAVDDESAGGKELVLLR